MKSHTFGLFVLVLFTALLAGCNSNPANKPRAVSNVPPAKPEPLDQRLRERATQLIVESRNSLDPIIRANSIEAMKQVYRAEFEPKILAGFEDASPIVRKSASLASGELRLESARAGLTRAAEDVDKQVAIAGTFGLLRLGDQSRWQAIEAFASDPDAGVRGDTVLILGFLKDPRAIAILKRLKRDRDPGVGLQSIEALWRCGDKEAAEDLIGLTLSRYPDEQIVATLALAAPGDIRVIEHIRAALNSEYTEVRLAAARGLGQLGSDDGLNLAVRGIREYDPRLREMGAMALGAIGRSDTQGYLRSLMDDKLTSVKLAAAMAILQLHEPSH